MVEIHERARKANRTVAAVVTFAILTGVLSPWAWASGVPWRALKQGLEYAEFTAPLRSTHGDSKIRILRIDPTYFELKLVNASARPDGKPLTTKEWVRQENLAAAINASMFHADYRTSVALMKTKGHTNNPRVTKDKAVLAFHPLISSIPPVQIIDRECQDFHQLQRQYASLVQNIRMISCRGNNVWAQQKRAWSTAAVGTDLQGRVLFIHVRSPYSVHDLIDMLLALPIELRNAMYVEGGPEAQLYVKSGDVELELVGSFETGFYERDDNTRAWPIPNAIGVRRKEGTNRP